MPDRLYDFETYLIVRVHVLLFVTVVWLAVWQLPQVRMGHRVQLFVDFPVIQTNGEVIGAVAPKAQEVWVRSFFQQQFDQEEILLVHSQVERAATVMLLL